jgi:hypothetical protein
MTPTAFVQPESQAAARLHGRVLARQTLDTRTRNAMFSLLAAHFVGVDRTTFNRDLEDKSCAILLEDDAGDLRGFSTMVVYESRAAGTPVSVVYSGDTIVDRAWWGSPALARTWVRAVRQLAPENEPRDVYWLLLTSGFRTYRFLPVFFREFYPRFDAVTPPRDATLLDVLAGERFGQQYDAASGVVRFVHPQILAPDLVTLPRHRMTRKNTEHGPVPDPHIAFFLERNPGFVRGDELVCLTRIDEQNLTPAGRRMARPSSLER